MFDSHPQWHILDMKLGAEVKLASNYFQVTYAGGNPPATLTVHPPALAAGGKGLDPTAPSGCISSANLTE